MTSAWNEWDLAARALIGAAEEVLKSGLTPDHDALDRLAAQWAAARAHYAQVVALAGGGAATSGIALAD